MATQQELDFAYEKGWEDAESGNDVDAFGQDDSALSEEWQRGHRDRSAQLGGPQNSNAPDNS